jgi:hypothetical protein
VAGAGFQPCFSRDDEFEFHASAEEYRQRFSLLLLRKLIERLG